MTTAITLITPDIYGTFDKMAKDIVASQFTRLTEFQVKYIFLKGYELGISPMQALDGINNIAGKPTCSPQLMLALINRSGQVEDIIIDSDDARCVVTMKRKGRSAHTETFWLKDAKAMGLDSKDNWKKQPRIMMKWRCVAACARIVYPDIIQNLLTHEEMGADVSVTDDGDMVVISKPVDPPQPPAVQIPATVEPVVVTSTATPTPPASAPVTPKYGVTTNAGEPPAGEYKPNKWTQTEKDYFWEKALPLYDHPNHAGNSIEKMKMAGAFNGKTPDEALDIVRKHVAEKVAS